MTFYPGQGPHNEHPFSILFRPVETGLVSVEVLHQRLDQAISLFNGHIEELPEHDRGDCKQGLLLILEEKPDVRFREAQVLINVLLERLHWKWDAVC
jgi:hypothetical protein